MCSHYTRLSGVMVTRLTLHEKTSGSILDWVDKKFFLFGSSFDLWTSRVQSERSTDWAIPPFMFKTLYFNSTILLAHFTKTFQNDFTQHALLRMRSALRMRHAQGTEILSHMSISSTLQTPIEIPMMLIWNNNYYPSMTRILMNTLFDIRIYTLSDLGHSSNLTG